ncbi:aldose 1-epimerase family protein [Sphingomonas sp. 37zxx]|uniref:aldose 1-epimerase family protein n=1 Tax=Sphingomonas sp. 37zxx TaxID=1550073 RepID=UPI002F429278
MTISDEALSAAVNPLGAELSSLTDTGGREWMTNADPAFWTGRSPLLFPIVGALNGGRYRVDGVTYELPPHGFARRREFAQLGRSDTQVRFRLTDDAATRAIYPFGFALDVEYRIGNGALTIICTVTNQGDTPMPCSFGYHPAFAWPLPGEAGKNGHMLRFEADEPGMLTRLDRGLVAGADRASPLADGRTLALDDALFTEDALIWDGLASRTVDYSGPNGARLQVAFPGADTIGVWTKPGARFLCIEPWWGIADPRGFTGELRDKPGMMVLAPHDSRRFTMIVTPH